MAHSSRPWWLLVAADVYDRLHFTGPAAIFAPCFALAVVIDEGPLSQAGLKSVLVALLLLGSIRAGARDGAGGVRSRARSSGLRGARASDDRASRRAAAGGARGLGDVMARDPVRQAVVVSLYGLTLGILFFAFQAPGRGAFEHRYWRGGDADDDPARDRQDRRD